MNDPMIIAAAIVLVIAAVGSMFVQIINAKAAAEDRQDARASRIKLETYAEINDGKNNKIIEQGVSIHTLTNSNLSTVTAALATAVAENKTLERIIAAALEAKKVADNLARERRTDTSFVQPKVLEEIKENTADTVHAVKDLKGKK